MIPFQFYETCKYKTLTNKFKTAVSKRKIHNQIHKYYLKKIHTMESGIPHEYI